MDIASYLVTPVEYRKLLSVNQDLNSPVYDEPITIMSRRDGKTKFIIKDRETASSLSYIYITIQEIAVKSMLDKQVVRSVNPVYDFSGTIMYYESSVGDAH